MPPETLIRPLRRRIIYVARRVAIALLVLTLFWAGTYDKQIFPVLTTTWQKLLAALGFTEQLAAMQHKVSGEVTKRSLPAVVTYALLYMGVGLVLLRLLLPVQRMRLVLLLYGSVLGSYVLLLLGGKAAGDVMWMYQLGRRLIDFLVSPLPIILLAILLRWYARAPDKPS